MCSPLAIQTGDIKLETNAQEKNEEESLSAVQLCVICLNSSISGTRWWSRFENKSSDHCLDKHLSSIFLLKNLLQLSKAQCIETLEKSFGVDPGNWCVVCESCAELLSTGVKIHRQICDLKRQQETVRKELKAKLKFSLKLKPVKGWSRNLDVVELHTTIRDNLEAVHAEANVIDRRVEECGDADIDDENTEKNYMSEDKEELSKTENLESPESDPPLPLKRKSIKQIKATRMKKSRKKKKMSKKQNYKCDICPCKYASEPGLYIHKNLHNKYPLTCDICKYPLKDDTALKKHLRLKHPLLKKDETLEQTENLDTDELLKSIKPRKTKMPHDVTRQLYKCSICPGKYSRMSSLQSHQRHHDLYIENTCKICNYPCKNSLQLKHHHQLKHTPNTTNCTRCEFRGTSTAQLVAHANQHKMLDNMEPIQEDFRCKLCSETSSKVSVFEHMKNTHAQEIGMDVVTCHICGKIFSSEKNLNNVHENERRFSCTICGKGFDRKHKFESHMDKHNNDGKSTIVCDSCGLDFADRSNLEVHIKRFHSGLERKPRRGQVSLSGKSQSLQCKYCSILVVHDMALKLHVKTVHPELLKFKCDQCSSSYLHSCGLETHKKAKHSGEKWTCPYCQKEVLCEAYLKGHWRQHCKKYPGNLTG